MGLSGWLEDTTFEWNKFKGKLRFDRPVSWKFQVEVDGIGDTGFMTCDGLSDRIRTEKLTQCNEIIPALEVPVSREVGQLVLTKAYTFDSPFEKWLYEINNFKRGGKDPRRNVVIYQLYNIPPIVPILGGKAIEIASWYLPQAMIIDVTQPSRDATKDGLSIMSYTIKGRDIINTTNYGDITMLMSLMQQYL